MGYDLTPQTPELSAPAQDPGDGAAGGARVDPVALVEPVLERFTTITLKEMDSVKLMDRLDTKFTFRIEQLPAVLAEMVPHYRLLEVGGVHANRYETLYFDTTSLGLYLRHHSGKFSRYKLRYRRYVDSDLCFFEVKVKNNKGRTIKQRIRRPTIESGLSREAATLLETLTPLNPAEFQPALWVNFTRLTFVSRTASERMTVDVGLTFSNRETTRAMPSLVIAEVKQEKATAHSRFIDLMRERRIWQGSMSKYCFGVVNLYPSVKKNRFIERVKQLRKLAS